MIEQEVFVLADRALNEVVAQIREDQWAMEMPADFHQNTVKDHTPTLREIVNYHAYDDAWVPDMLAGKTMAEAGNEKFKGDLLGDDPSGSFAAIVEKAVSSAQQLQDPEHGVHCSFGDYTAQGYLQQANNFRALRAHDITRVIGSDYQVPDAVVQGVWDEISPHAEEWRTIGVFPAEVEVADDAPLIDRLLGLTGRHPHGLETGTS